MGRFLAVTTGGNGATVAYSAGGGWPSTVPGTVPIIENYPVQNVNSAETEKLYFRQSLWVVWFVLQY